MRLAGDGGHRGRRPSRRSASPGAAPAQGARSAGQQRSAAGEDDVAHQLLVPLGLGREHRRERQVPDGSGHGLGWRQLRVLTLEVDRRQRLHVGCHRNAAPIRQCVFDGLERFRVRHPCDRFEGLVGSQPHHRLRVPERHAAALFAARFDRRRAPFDGAARDRSEFVRAATDRRGALRARELAHELSRSDRRRGGPIATTLPSSTATAFVALRPARECRRARRGDRNESASAPHRARGPASKTSSAVCCALRRSVDCARSGAAGAPTVPLRARAVSMSGWRPDPARRRLGARRRPTGRQRGFRPPTQPGCHPAQIEHYGVELHLGRVPRLANVRIFATPPRPRRRKTRRAACGRAAQKTPP